MSTVFQSSGVASSAAEVKASPDGQFSFQQIMALVLSGKGLRLALIVGAMFLAWKTFQGLRSLFWAAFGIAWVLFWTHGWTWFRF